MSSMPKVVVFKTIVLSILISFIAFFVIFLSRYLFGSTYRFASMSFSVFNVQRLLYMIFPYFWMNLIFFLALSTFLNVMLYTNRAWKLNCFMLAIFVSLPCIVLIAIQVLTTLSGKPLLYGISTPYNQFVLWLLP